MQNKQVGHALKQVAPHLPIVWPYMSSSKVNSWGLVVGDEVLACEAGPTSARVHCLTRTALGVEALFTHCDHVVGVCLLQVLGHLINP